MLCLTSLVNFSGQNHLLFWKYPKFSVSGAWQEIESIIRVLGRLNKNILCMNEPRGCAEVV